MCATLRQKHFSFYPTHARMSCKQQKTRYEQTAIWRGCVGREESLDSTVVDLRLRVDCIEAHPRTSLQWNPLEDSKERGQSTYSSVTFQATAILELLITKARKRIEKTRTVDGLAEERHRSLVVARHEVSGSASDAVQAYHRRENVLE